MTTGSLTGPIPYNPVILSLIRRVMPSIIASQLVGVQPMTGPTGSIFAMRSRLYKPPRIKMTNMHYKVFLRLNNRKKSQTEDDFIKAKYHKLRLRYDLLALMPDCLEWCDFQFGKCGYIQDAGTFWFENENDVTAFKLRWL